MEIFDHHVPKLRKAIHGKDSWYFENEKIFFSNWQCGAMIFFKQFSNMYFSDYEEEIVYYVDQYDTWKFADNEEIKLKTLYIN